ncbi:complement C5-like [Anarrhichthys ocellatus]|uniref:complement C5-like n=1 Tax=Anarrhichthys ocellatus TaxID=433405 RepID=UPI0012EE6E5F|nr:complement C5-like [Anarrhichthys ocellatus]
MDIQGGTTPGLSSMLCSSGTTTPRTLVEVDVPGLRDAPAVASLLGLKSIRQSRRILSRLAERLTVDEVEMLKEDDRGEEASDSTDLFPDLGFIAELNGVSGPSFSETESELLDLHTVKGKTIYTNCVKVLNRNKLDQRADTVWRQNLNMDIGAKPFLKIKSLSVALSLSPCLSFRLTALVVKTLSVVDPVVSVDHHTLSDSVSWLIRRAQQQDGSFTDKSSFRANKVMAVGTSAVDQSVYLTSFVLIALHKATNIKVPILHLQFHDDSMRSAVNYISQHALGVKSVYVRAVATYALTLRDPDSMAASELLNSLEKLARDKGHPAVLRYWQESSVTADWLKPDQSSGLTVEATAYVLLTVLMKGRIPYANPILSWLTQDQHYGEGFYSIQDTHLTLEAVTEYSKVVPRAVLNQDINVRYSRKGSLGRVQLSQSQPVATPIQVTKDDDITVSTGYGKGVSNVKMKTVYYETTSPALSCNFDLTIEVVGPDTSGDPSLSAPHLVACAKYKPPLNEVSTESSLTVMKIQLPTGVEGYLEDLRQFRDSDEPMISHYELQGTTVVIQMDSVPSDVFLCVGFRIRTRFRVGGASESLFSVYEPQDRGSECTKRFSYEQQKLQRLCVDEQCQCMTAACAAFRGNVDVTLTAAKRTNETCRQHIKYAYKVMVKSSAGEGDFMTHTATVVEVLKNTDKEFEAVSSGTVVELVKKATCSSVDIQNNQQYLVMGARGSEVMLSQGFKYRLPLDSEALVELLPSPCSSPECLDYTSQLEDFALDLQLSGCPDSS